MVEPINTCHFKWENILVQVTVDIKFILQECDFMEHIIQFIRRRPTLHQLIQ